MKLHNFVLKDNILSNYDALVGVARTGDATAHLQDECDVDNEMHQRRRDLEKSSLRTLLTNELERKCLPRPRRGGVGI